MERAALELFVECGIDGASIRQIAERAEVTEGALYRHHASKDDLVRYLFFQYFQGYADLMKAADQKGRAIEDKLFAMIDGFYAAYDEDPKGFQFVLLVQHELLDAVRQDMANPVDVITSVIDGAIKRGEIPEQNVALSTQLLLGMVMQSAVGNRYGRLKGKLRPYARTITNTCFAVLKTAPQ
ncbi:TetR/AcrR family transcriptional regulator [bacterium]|nr:TetR/AcrR family transcriptional regulator [bacterium]